MTFPFERIDHRMKLKKFCLIFDLNGLGDNVILNGQEGEDNRIGFLNDLKQSFHVKKSIVVKREGSDELLTIIHLIDGVNLGFLKNLIKALHPLHYDRISVNSISNWGEGVAYLNSIRAPSHSALDPAIFGTPERTFSYIYNLVEEDLATERGREEVLRNRTERVGRQWLVDEEGIVRRNHNAKANWLADGWEQNF